MSIKSYLKAPIKAVGRKLFGYIYAEPDLKGLRFLTKFGGHVYGLPLFWFWLQNRKRLLRWLELRARGIHPKVVFVTVEGDRRFTRLLEIARANEEKLFFFELPIMCFRADQLRFAEYIEKSYHEWERATGLPRRYANPFDIYYAEENLANREAYRKDVVPVLLYLKKLFNPKLIASGSLFDHYAVELTSIAKKNGIKWMICEREGTQSEISAEMLAEYMIKHKAVHVDYITTANVLHRRCFREGANQDGNLRVELVGELRSDHWVRADYKFDHPNYAEWTKYRKKVLYLAFGMRHFIEPMDHPHIKNANWCQLIDETQEQLFQFAKANPDILVYYKMGHVEPYHKPFIARVGESGLKNIVFLDRAFPCEELLAYVDLIIGFQTTAMIEAMFGQKPIFYTFWGIHPEVNVEKDILPLQNTGAVKTITSAEMLGSSLREWEQGKCAVSKEELAARRKTREYYFHEPDGFVAERVLGIMAELVGVEVTQTRPAPLWPKLDPRAEL